MRCVYCYEAAADPGYDRCTPCRTYRDEEWLQLRLHRDVDPESDCGGQVADGQELFNTDYWCVYCGAKWSEEVTT